MSCVAPAEAGTPNFLRLLQPRLEFSRHLQLLKPASISQDYPKIPPGNFDFTALVRMLAIKRVPHPKPRK
jgi:hypothetical protein